MIEFELFDCFKRSSDLKERYSCKKEYASVEVDQKFMTGVLPAVLK